MNFCLPGLMMDDQTLATINVDQLNQAVNNIISIGQQQTACSSVPVSSTGPAIPNLPHGKQIVVL
jgi:hypothetical protein